MRSIMPKCTLNDLDVAGKRTLLRVDFNVPLTPDHQVADATRIRAALPSIQAILNRGGFPILMSHLGRPKGKTSPALSLAPCAKALSLELGRIVHFSPDCIGETALHHVNALPKGEVLLLENLRFYPEEEVPDPDRQFAAALATLGQLYINDAFGTAHRCHSSIVPITRYFPQASAMGLLMEKELSILATLLSSPTPPFSLILGGAKLSTKITLLQALLPKIQELFIGGGMAFTFLKCQNVPIGHSIYDPTQLTQAQAIIDTCRQQNIPIHLPVDVVIEKVDSTPQELRTVTVKEGVPEGWRGMDIGPKTVAQWKPALFASATAFWNGPMGVYEVPAFAAGTISIATLLSQTQATTIVGGGDSVAAIKKLQLEAAFTHLSTGGGAALAYLEHGHLPGIDALSDTPLSKNS